MKKSKSKGLKKVFGKKKSKGDVNDEPEEDESDDDKYFKLGAGTL